MAMPGLRLTAIVAAVCMVLALATLNNVCANEGVVRIVVLGDSFVAGYGVPAADAFPVKLEQALTARGQSVEVVNAGIAGDTAAMGLARLSQAVTDDTDAVILELGTNDMLMGLEPNVTRTALSAILSNLESRRIAVLLCGVRTRAPFRSEYKSAFAAMFSGLASEYNVLFYPAFDAAFVDDAQLKQPDGLHPTAAGIEKGTVGQFLAGVADCMKWLRRETIGFVKGDAKPVYHFAWTNATP